MRVKHEKALSNELLFTTIGPLLHRLGSLLPNLLEPSFLGLHLPLSLLFFSPIDQALKELFVDFNFKLGLAPKKVQHVNFNKDNLFFIRL